MGVDGDAYGGDVVQHGENVVTCGVQPPSDPPQPAHAVAELGDGVVGADRCPRLIQAVKDGPV